MSHHQPTWWKEATVFQVWPMSYKDSNGDGIGDIPGLISTLDYLKDLGIDVIWVSPMYDSPQKDYGYDISDYQKVYPPFGTVEDMDELVKQCHARGMKLILDLVINHTSDQHKWFLESKSSKANDKSDWYIWKDPKIVDGKKCPPTNWKAIFGGSAWEYVPDRDQYYLHLFVPEQPDLNWENPQTRKAIYKEAVEFWLDRGVDGFRVDTVNLYSKNTEYPDAPIAVPHEPYQPADRFFVNGPRMHEFLQELQREVLQKYGDILMVGECAGTEYEEVLKYVEADRDELSCVFDFDVVSLGGRHDFALRKHHVYQYILPEFKEAFKKVQDLIQNSSAWGTVFLENHDQARSVSRFATDTDEYREKAAKVLAILLCTLSGTLFVYQGQEIGMYNIPKEWGIGEIRDVDSLNSYEEVRELHGGDEMWLKKAMRGIQMVGRDNARTPVQWDTSAHAGFTTGTPWMRVHDAYARTNIATQVSDPDSPLSFWRSMLRLRKQYRSLTTFGSFSVHDINDVDTFTFWKTDKEGRAMLVILNFTGEVQPWDVPPAIKGRELELVVHNAGSEGVGRYLGPWEGRVYVTK